MNQLSKKDKEIYLGIFHDILLWEINRLEDKTGDPAMWDYQIKVLGKADPIKYARKINGLKRTRQSTLAKWQKNLKKIKDLKDELEVYERLLKKVRG
jgi:uncharacterized membrane protein